MKNEEVNYISCQSEQQLRLCIRQIISSKKHYSDRLLTFANFSESIQAFRHPGEPPPSYNPTNTQLCTKAESRQAHSTTHMGM